jgi:hypothetical protein
LCCLQETAAELEAESADTAAEELNEAGGEGGQPLSARDILQRAVAKMGAGIALCAVFSDPLVEALTNLSRCGSGPAIADEAGAAEAAAQQCTPNTHRQQHQLRQRQQA